MTKSIRALMVKRLLLTVPVLFGVSVLVFSFVAFSPQSPAIARLGNLDQEAVRRLEQELGINRPLPQQYFDWLGLDFLLPEGTAISSGGVLTGNLGQSMINGQPVAEIVADKWLISAELALWAFLWMVVFAFGLGLIAAFNRNELPDHISRIYAILGISIPDFVVGIFLILTFGAYLNVLPAGGWVPWSEGIIPHMKHIIMPSFTIGFLITGLIMRLFRSDLLDTMSQEHVKAAKAMGLSQKEIILKDIVKPAVIPTITSVGMSIASLMGGLVLTEIVFSIPGLGRLTVNAIFNGNYPIVQGVILITATIFVMLNLLVDLTYYYLDPRIRALEE